MFLRILKRIGSFIVGVLRRILWVLAVAILGLPVFISMGISWLFTGRVWEPIFKFMELVDRIAWE